MNTISLKLAEVKEKLRDHSPKANPVQILGVTKGIHTDLVREGFLAGIRLLGVNYVQEGKSLLFDPELSGAEWHFIGHIQGRKVKELLDYTCVQSIDRLSIAEELDRRLKGSEKIMKVLVEINIGTEATKSGISPGEAHGFLNALSKLCSIRVMGIMGMPPPLEPVEKRRF